MTQQTATAPNVITEAPFHPSLAVADLANARTWYADKLGWEPVVEPPGTLVYQVGDSFFTLYRSDFAGTAQNTVMNWTVASARAEVDRLRKRGVTFEEYDFGAAKTVDGIMSDPSGGEAAWFRDPDGNTIGILSTGPSLPPEVPDPDAGVSGMIAASDLARARDWYRDMLGFEPAFQLENVLATYRSGDSTFTVYQTEFAGTAKNTVGVWRLRGIRDEVGRLRRRGVEFEDEDFGEEGRTVDGILSDDDGDANAWFRDSEGNILALAEDRGGFV